MWVVSVDGEEWKHSCSYILGIVVCKFGCREELVPIVLFVVNVAMKVLFEYLVHALDLPINLLVECCEELSFGAHKFH